MSQRIAFVGTCQVTGMAATAAALATQLGHDWHIESYHIGTALNAAEIFNRIQGFDVVISQVHITDQTNAVLQTAALEGHVGRSVYMPTFVFTGLHPDMAYIAVEDKPLPGPYSDMHSLLAVACYLLGVPVRRAASLYNAFIFAEIGYFSAYATSCQVLVEQFDAAGYDMRGMPEHWLATGGPFMYTINHPAICVLSHMAILALTRAGLIEQGTNVPEGVPDHLHDHIVAPLFPALARRLGFSGSNEYLKPCFLGPERATDLIDYVRDSYAMYQNVDPELLATYLVVPVRERLAALLDQGIGRAA